MSMSAQFISAVPWKQVKMIVLAMLFQLGHINKGGMEVLNLFLSYILSHFYT